MAAADIVEKQHLTWWSIKLYKGLRKDFMKSSAFLPAVDFKYPGNLVLPARDMIT
jgi:hypothetical protein